MDQVKKILAILMAQRFWILCGAITLIPVGGWFSATSSMHATTEARKAAIKQKTDAAKTLLGKQGHPNDESHKYMDALRDKVTNEVGRAWSTQYDRQKELLAWPTELGKEFIEKVEPLRPLEKVKPPMTASDEILAPSLRELYRDYIFAELPKLAKKIDALWVVQEAAEGGSGGDGGSASAGGAMPTPGFTSGTATAANKSSSLIEKVVWSPQDQTALRARYDWRGTKDKAPRTIDVLYVQEDLWIMSALMDIIAKTNQGSSARYNAVVKEINYINIGREVGGSTGGVMRANAIGESGGGGMGMGGMDASSAMSSAGAAGMTSAAGGMSSAGGMGMTAGGEGGSSGGSSAMGMGTGAGTSLDPAQFRYVDLDYKPVPADTLRTAITSETQDPANAFLVVAKRIPIRLGLTVDQRKLNRFISECGNAPLMVEVRQVRFNRQGGSAGGSSGGMGMGMGGMSGGMSGMSGGMSGMGSGSMGMSGMGSGSMGMSGMGSSGFSGGAESGSGMSGMPGMPGMPGFGGSDSGAPPSDVSPHDKPVEVYGVVYLYNPVDLKRLGIEKKEADPSVPAVTPPATGTVPSPPASAPAASAPPASAVPASAVPASAAPASAAPAAAAAATK